MENLIPPVLRAVREIRWMIATGHSMSEALGQYLEAVHDPLSLDLRESWTLKSQAGALGVSKFGSPYQTALWELIVRGTRGEPVLEALTALEEEVELAASEEIERHLAMLPFRALIPLLGLQFPAHLVLLLGPLLRQMHSGLGG